MGRSRTTEQEQEILDATTIADSEDFTAMQVKAIRDLTELLPMNDFGLPTGIYRVDLLPFHDYKPHLANTPTPVPSVPNVLETPGADLVLHDPHDDTYHTGIDEDYRLLIDDNGDNYDDDGAPLYPVVRAPTLAELNGTTASDSNVVSVPVVHRTVGFPSAQLEKAFQPLQYSEGYPAQLDGRPFWGRLDFEPAEAYAVFERYLMMQSKGISRLDDDESEDGAVHLVDSGVEGSSMGAGGARSTSLLAAELCSDDQLLEAVERYREYFHLYYWALRAKSYDLFRVAQHRKALELRAMETNDEQYILSRRLMSRLEVYLNDDEDFWDMMTPKVAIDMLKQLTAMQRVASGLPAGGPASESKDGSARGGQSLEFVYRQVAQQDNRSRTEGGSSVLDQDGNEMLDDILTDPTKAALMQELVIRVGTR